MKIIPDWLKDGYLRLVDPVADWFIRRGVHPNTITAIGTACTIGGGVIFATGHIRTAGYFLGVTALFDVLDGTVVRRRRVIRRTRYVLRAGLGASQPVDDVGVHVRADRRIDDVVHSGASRSARTGREGRDGAAPGARGAALRAPGVFRTRARRLDSAVRHRGDHGRCVDHRDSAVAIRVS